MKKKVLPSLILYLSICLVLGMQSSTAQDLVETEEDISESWQVYEPDKNIFTDFNSIKRVRSVKWHLTNSETATSLIINGPTRSVLFINHKYSGLIKNRKIIELDSLELKLNTNSFEFVVYSKEFLNHANLTTILTRSEPISNAMGVVERNNIQGFINYFVTITFIILFFTGFLFRKFPRDTVDYFAFFRSLTLKNRETQISTRPFNRINILYIILASMLIGFVTVSLAVITKGFVHLPFIDPGLNFNMLILSWLLFSLLVFVALTIKFLVINAFSSMFQMGEFKYIQFFNSLRFSMGIFLLVFIMLVVTFLSNRIFELGAYILFIKFLYIMLMLRMLVLFFKLKDFSSYRIFHLFSYLCATEVIPFTIVYKLLLG